MKSVSNRKLNQILGQYTIVWLFLLVVIVMSLSNANFRQLANIQNIFLQASFIGIIAAGMTLLIINGGFDLSIAGMVGLCGIAISKLEPVIGVGPAIFVVLGLGVALGAINGLIVTKIRIPPFVATLGTMNIFIGVALIWTGGTVTIIDNSTIIFLGRERFAGIPIAFLIMIVVYLIYYFILRFTNYGRYITAIGSNETAARVAGLQTDRVKNFAFILVGFCGAITGILLSGYLTSANAIMATGFELRAIAVVVVGGTSLFGGQGTLIGSFTGALFFAVINNALNMFGVGAYWQYITVGLVLITALGLDEVRRKLTSTIIK